MVVNYPNGQPFHKVARPGNQQIYARPSQSNRGMHLEDDINAANRYYLALGQAVIHKKPTPIQIVHVDYPARAAAKITEAYFRQASTTDYNGVYQGYYLDFDAKETNNQRSFPLKNIHEHQVAHLKAVSDQAGLAMFLIRFNRLRETYLVDAKLIFKYWNAQQHDRKSIPYSAIKEYGIRIKANLQLALPYLDAVDQLIKLKDTKENC
ncbi:Holliday junction resolvase RecU [Weissella halotolerans]|uniref:Holliday junction resolvase RecU n=1 Tax=Weissella halotolerans DSM 20190 TaxID=1123500 RepID=A0A0R2G5Y3_9LACO|nr:Holliday junction resolvase RecU [Weissella halotolerans]KRN33573.1 recombination protein U [Weissella halotolerans DSM 20190]